ncbi:MAG: hypothetical protein F8N39_03525 [Clostridiaceae bacterium]|nr:hypothetical protein [Clostridiaceae bacterium]
MVKSSIDMTFSAPTRECAKKILYIQCENAINIPRTELNGRTIYEETVATGKADALTKFVPNIKKQLIYKEYLKMLPLKKQEFLYESVYTKTGGILNVFNPSVKENMDIQLKMLKRENPVHKEVISKWKDINSELWSNLPPKLVWCGGGSQEIALLSDLSKEMETYIGEVSFECVGEAVLMALKFLRAWQYKENHICDNRKPVEAIIEERQQVYYRKISFLKDIGISCDF